MKSYVIITYYKLLLYVPIVTAYTVMDDIFKRLLVVTVKATFIAAIKHGGKLLSHDV